MKNILLIAIGLIVGFLGCFLMKDDTNSVTVNSETTEATGTEAYLSLKSQIEEALAQKDFDSTVGGFINKKELQVAVDSFDIWHQAIQPHSPDVLIPKSVFIGKDKLDTLIQRMAEINRQSNGKDKVGGLVLKFAIRDTTSIGESTIYGSRLDVIMYPARVNKKPIIKEALELSTEDGTIVDKTIPCPDAC